MDRRIILVLVAVIAVVSAAVGWVAGQQIKSPAEIAASQQPPPPSLITVPVEFRTLAQNVVIRGTVRPSDETDLTVSSLGGDTVITRVLKEKGDLIEEGDVIVEVAGRPVIALKGQLPAFRNLIPSLEGPDVRQLEEALVRLGYEPGDVDDAYTASTATAVEKLYRDRGYSPPESDEADRSGFALAEDSIEAAEQTLASAKEALAEAEKPLTDTERKQLDLAVDQAEGAVASARLDASQAKAAAASAVTDAEAARTAAAKEAETAAARLAQAQGGTSPDSGQAPTAEETAALEAADREAKAALAAAERELQNARDEQPRTTRDQDLAVRAAEVALLEAKAQRTDRLAPPDLSTLRAAVTSATEALTDARSDLNDAGSRVGAWIPAAEVTFLSSVPRQVASSFVEVGDSPTGSIMTISGAETIVESGISSADRRLIKVGDEATLEDDDLGISLDAVITFVADTEGGPGLSDDRFALRLEPVGEVPEEALNVNLRISIPITSSGGDVLAVPLAALSAGADGTARVEVERSEGDTELVKVSTGLRAEGFVQIEPLEDPLEAGDRVVVGRDLVLPGSSAESEPDSGGDSSEEDPEDDSEDGDT